MTESSLDGTSGETGKSKPLTFTEAFSKQNIYMETAIKSLDNLNDQIVQFIYTPTRRKFGHEHRQNADVELSPKDHETLKSSMLLMRHLLVDAQCKFRKMVEDNKRLAARIDSSLSAANQEVKAIRDELADTNHRLTQIGRTSDGSSMKDSGAEEETGISDASNKSLDNQERDELYVLRDENTKLHDMIAKLKTELQSLKYPDCRSGVPPYANIELAKENSIDYGGEQVAPPAKIGDSNGSSHQAATTSSCNDSSHQRSAAHNEQLRELQQRMVLAHQELSRAKEALLAMKADRKRLQAEKLDLLSQLRQLYCTLEDKESEIRDFIRNFEQQMRENNENIKQMVMDKEESEQEKWELLRRAQESSERCVLLKTELEQKDKLIEELQQHLSDARERLRNCDNTFQSGSEVSPSLQSSMRSSQLKSSSVSVDSVLKSSHHDRQSASSEDLPPYQEIVSTENIRTTPSCKSLKSDSSQLSPSDVFSPRLSMLTEDNYQGKLEAIRQAKELGITKWKAGHVLSWVEIEMNMPMYGKACSENIKSGKVLLGLSDSELDSALGLESALHRRKLRLAIEELRDPSTIQYTKAGHLDHTWVSHRFLPDLGLPQYSSHFEAQLVDGRLLNVLTKKDMEKYLGMQKKFHQTSVLYGVELLRRLKYDKEELSSRRGKCENSDSDPLVWTNHRLLQWLQGIDLQEYISSLKESGIHGALLVLESSFNADTFATALNIPTNKSYVRRHLASELDNLIRPARSAIESAAKRRGTSSNNVSRSFIRSYRGGPNTDVQDGTKGTSKRLSFRGSLGRALGRRNRQDNKKNGSTSSVDDMVIDDGHRQSENVVKDGTIV